MRIHIYLLNSKEGQAKYHAEHSYEVSKIHNAEKNTKMKPMKKLKE